ncbi:asparagine synthase-related protein [Aliiglaciecola lipolytica]|uniref:asparagine synthase (glutamine-hydrolyzing) n=1 Tax=Aliiglaciecola lipolytica E3 TaxID=1127673 RepID=K6YIK3_9ALTE|nr:asparagine synthase C-terminal domain-containing protein [Aliiglaciecola lipolytica]GAC16438.1 hypothetical protein GLIP_3827 [Aliiglaciecola lipolytica E3]
MKSLFALFGSKSASYFEKISQYYAQKNKSIISNSYDVSSSTKQMVILGDVRPSDQIDLTNFAPHDPYVILSGNHAESAHNTCNIALKDHALRDLIADDYTRTIKQLAGDFILICWDQRSCELRFSTSAFNPRSLFYVFKDDCFIVSSDLALLQFLTPPKIDETAISQWLAGRPDPNRSMFSNIHQLPFAHTGVISSTRPLKVERFWDIDQNHSLTLADESEYQAYFFDLLSQSVKEKLDFITDGPALQALFSQMSGGMDSTSITAMLHSQIQANDKLSLHSISHTYRDTQSCNEIDKIEEMRTFLALQHSHFVELDQFSEHTFARLYPTQLQNPGVVASPKYLQEAQIIRQLAGRHLFTGNGGDEMCWGHSFAYRDRLISGDLSVIKEVFKSAKLLGMSPLSVMLQVLVKPALPASLLALLGKKPVDAEHFPAWLGAKQQEVLAGISKHNPFSDSNQLAKRARYEGLFHTSTFNSMRSYQHVCDPLGIDVHHPFFNKKIAEFSFAIPQKLHIQGQYPKYLLRKAMDGHLPNSVCWDQNKTVFDQHFANLVRANKNELRQLLAHPGLQDLGLIDNNILLASFDHVVETPNGSLNVDLLYAILTQSWYQTHIL